MFVQADGFDVCDVTVDVCLLRFGQVFLFLPPVVELFGLLHESCLIVSRGWSKDHANTIC